jgi:hypothetical protein
MTQTWEYTEVSVEGGNVTWENGAQPMEATFWNVYLEQMGLSGWELVIKHYFSPTNFEATFKRPK